MKGSRGETSRTGGETSGINCHIRGWNHGVKVTLYKDAEGFEWVNIVLTGGSNNPSELRTILDSRLEYLRLLEDA